MTIYSLMSWPQIQKIIILKYHLLLFYATTTNHFSIRSWHVMKRILYHNWRWQAQWLDREEAPQHCPKPNLHHKKVMVTVQWSAARLIHYIFFWWNHYIWDVCSANQWHAPKTAMPAASSGQQNGPNSPWQHLTVCLTTNISKAERIELWSFAPSTISTRTLANRLPLL